MKSDKFRTYRLERITEASEPGDGANAADGPVTVGGVSLDADGNVIPQDSRKDAPGIRKGYQGITEVPLASKCEEWRQN